MKKWMNQFTKITFAFLVLMAMHTVVHAQGTGAELVLVPTQSSADNGQTFSVAVRLLNPSQQNIISVRAWLNYNPNVLEATSIDAQDSPFQLVAPGENDLNAKEGHVQIGRSNISGGFSGSEAVIATVQFKVLAKQKGVATIDFFDYQSSELGHTNVNIITQGLPLNILTKKPDALGIKVNQNASAGSNGGNTPSTTDPNHSEQPLEIGGGTITTVLAPYDLKIGTETGAIELKWQAPNDPNRIGFNVYYGKQSGLYTRRRTLGETNQFRLEGLSNGETYYLAVSAFDSTNQESDYSNEVGAIVGQPLSATHQFQAFLNNYLSQIPQQPQNGPLTGWLVVSAMGMGGALTLRKKKVTCHTHPNKK
ncbi:hypothetical protein IPJ72_05895 [Candidatus Peregrinibacteria bacterium]|nr:MAG: hypothetical protein IPJ72_05895 [Candidatus Peregrinibacteria bacterium]